MTSLSRSLGAAGAAAAPAAGECVNSDIPCRNCGYNLRGLREDMACPECGTAVGLSTRGDFLRFADPTWVDLIARGAAIIVWSILAQFAAVSLGVWISTLTGNTIFLSLLTVAASLISAVGVWKLTTPPAGRIDADPYSHARKIIRTTLLITIGASILAIGGQFLPQSKERDILLTLFGLMAGLVSVSSAYFLYLYIQHLADGIPDELLAKRAAFLRIAFVLTTLPVQLLEAFTRISALGQTNAAKLRMLDALRVVSVVLGVVAFAVAIVSIFFLVRFSRRLREQARSARTSWAADAAMPTPN